MVVTFLPTPVVRSLYAGDDYVGLAVQRRGRRTACGEKRRALVVRVSGRVPESVRRHVQRWGGDPAGVVALNRVLFSEEEVSEDGRVKLSGEDFRAWHIRNVLNAVDGSTVRAGVVDGGIHDSAEVTLREEGALEISLGDQAAGADGIRENCPKVDVLLALPRPRVMGRLWSTIASLGVRNIIIVNAYRVEKAYFNAKVMREEEVRNGLIEGLMQAGCDTRLPRVSVHKRLKFFLEDELDDICPTREAIRIVGHPDPEAKRVAELSLERDQRVLVAVGPVSTPWRATTLPRRQTEHSQSDLGATRMLPASRPKKIIPTLVRTHLETMTTTHCPRPKTSSRL